ncbi:response regulator transcription factor [Ancylobacter sp. Lp-2]|uniref:LuxR C-terminal-related transcriptional regulator n=1 Tax=Ancylobacter sp. Lp-2 TaxID=2881339 RepID=UPI001E2EFB66|nr:response regulator transcription factor [Ancylobacter sp. Lp-2]MCB4769608.1 response regulator transcription factor [Ancylobacter sp. Lp-2]
MNFECSSVYSSASSQKNRHSTSRAELYGDVDLVSSKDVVRPERGRAEIVLIEPRTLHAQCMLQSLRAAEFSVEMERYVSLSEWMQAEDSGDTVLVLLSMTSVSSGEGGATSLERDIAQLKARRPSVKFAVLSDHEAPSLVLKAMQGGAQGYLPTSLSIEVLAQVLQLLKAGGTYVPTSSLMGMVAAPKGDFGQPADGGSIFGSHRQMLVARALSKGAPNKVIAYQLSMCESTVKVHVRNIMKKLKAKNRTEVALLISQMIPDGNGE